MIKYKSLVQRILNQVVVVLVFYPIEKLSVMIKMETVKKINFICLTKTNSPTGKSGATSLSPNGSSFMYIETSASNNVNDAFCSIERTDFIQNSNITF